MSGRRITDAEIKRMLDFLQSRGTFGASRHELAPKFGGDRHARRIIERIRDDAIAPVISGINAAGVRTYRIANTREEYEEFRRSMIHRIRALASGVRGLDAAYKWEDQELSPILERIIELGEVAGA